MNAKSIPSPPAGELLPRGNIPDRGEEYYRRTTKVVQYWQQAERSELGGETTTIRQSSSFEATSTEETLTRIRNPDA